MATRIPDMRPAPPRVWLAFLVAPLASLAVLVLISAVGSLVARGPGEQPLNRLLGVSLAIYLIGYPVTLGIELLIGLPMVWWLWQRGHLETGRIVAVASVVGALGLAAFGTGDARAVWWLLPVGAAMGAAGGIVFSRIGLREQGATGPSNETLQPTEPKASG